MTLFSREVRIGQRTVGRDHSPYVIAEVGSNHDGSIDRALELITACAVAGADAVKFQSFTQATIASPRCSHLRDAFKQHELPDSWLPDLATAAEEAGIDFMSTPFHLGAVEVLDRLDVPAFKIASGDLTNHSLLRAAAATGRPLIISTGAARLGDIESALDVIESACGSDVVMLHCVSSYPPAFGDLNLRAMETIAMAFQVPVGFSDHTPGSVAAVTAVALGAAVIEKHVTSDRALPGPDHPYALTVPEFAQLVTDVGNAWDALGSPRKEPTSDAAERHWAWRGLYAARNLRFGDVITEADVIALRPRDGVGADQIDELLGRRVVADVEIGAPIAWGCVESRPPAG